MKGIAEEGVTLRSMQPADAELLSTSFAAIGWAKPPSLFARYIEEHRAGVRWVRVAEVDGRAAGYVTLQWSASDPKLRSLGIPEIMDLNVLPTFRRRGLGSALLAAAEGEAASRGPLVGLRVGLHSGYGAAQRLYVRRGYVPDGAGAQVGGEAVEEGAAVLLDDELTLRMTRDVWEGRSEFGSI